MIKAKVTWLLALFASVFVTMMIMWVIKRVSLKYNIPIASDMAREV